MGERWGDTHHIWCPEIAHLVSLTAHATFVESFHASYVSPISHGCRNEEGRVHAGRQYLSVMSNIMKNVGCHIGNIHLIEPGVWMILRIFLCKSVDRLLGTPIRRRIQVLTRSVTLFIPSHIVSPRARSPQSGMGEWMCRQYALNV